ncbi:CCA tRNA nucleotidyltransferase [Cohnella caldifontis]|uniref:CCA tRNA nucleotidyltransferase n=1 Tax=Cohnella caldifontis TaxID=3027471 RepID=UPI0023EBD164|nr:CCA tRNA nucleotidyltransferase [Cohnella sp. YIM B05605]
MPSVGRQEDEALWGAGLDVVRKLAACGHEAYLVGGCVRDRLLGRPLHDVDIATSAWPEEVSAAFDRTIPTGLRHGTVTVLHKGRTFEVTTFRTEFGYADARRPDRVEFVRELRRDLARRDFTINAMAVGLDGSVVDPFGGREDLGRRMIRCVGDAAERFGEDALRMLRAIRFAAAFGFGLPLSVWRGIRLQAPRLRLVAMERIGSEWEKMMAGADPERACRLLLRSGLLKAVKEPLPACVTAMTAMPIRSGMRELSAIRDPEIRWASWLIRAGAAAYEAETLCRTLRYSAKRVTRIAAMLRFEERMANGFGNRQAFIEAVLDLGHSVASDWTETREQAGLYRGWLDELPIHSAGQLAVRGDELARRLNRQPGPWIAAALRRLLHDVAFGRLANEKETLLEAAARQADGPTPKPANADTGDES